MSMIVIMLPTLRACVCAYVCACVRAPPKVNILGFIRLSVGHQISAFSLEKIMLVSVFTLNIGCNGISDFPEVIKCVIFLPLSPCLLYFNLFSI